MASVNNENPDCPNCNKAGLAILPVRYAVVPNGIDASLPAGLGNKVVDVPMKHHRYALRTLRQGFVYLFYEKHPHGSHIKWEVYSVEPGGTLWKQISSASAGPVEGPMCSRKEHSIPASIITISTPEKCGQVWLAFSEHLWSEETFRAFEADSQLRDRRMQTFAPALWVKSKGYRHGIEATEGNLNEIIEYKSGFPLSKLGRNNVTEISKPDGSYNIDGLKSCATRYQITVRRDDKAKLAGLMRMVGEKPNSVGYVPVIIALWDHVGIAHELNGFRNDAIGWVEKYAQERDLEIGAINAIDGARTALERMEIAAATSGVEGGVFRWNVEATRRRLEAYQQAYPGDEQGLARQRELCGRWERDAAQRLPNSIARRREQYLGLPEKEWRAGMSTVDLSAQRVTTPEQSTGKSLTQQRDQAVQRRAAEASAAAAQTWAKYEAKLDMPRLNKFRANYVAFISTASKSADDRTEDLVRWLKSPFLLDALTEFGTSSVDDGVNFEDTVGEMLLGINSSKAGQILISTWVAEKKTSPGNLLWRALAMNQTEGLNAVDHILTGINDTENVPFTETALDSLGASIKHFSKLADLSKKGLSLHNTLRKSGVYRTRTGGIEKILMTAGQILFQPFVKKGTDLLAEKFVACLLLSRAGLDYSKVMALMLAEARFGRVGSTQTLVSLSMGHALAAGRASKEMAALQHAWSGLVTDIEVPKSHTNPKLAGGFNEAAELRVGMLATLFQMAYVAKLCLDVKGHPDEKRLTGELWAAGFALGAGVADLGATAIKALHQLKDTALSFQSLKVAGGVLSAASSWMQWQHSDNKAETAEQYGQNNIARLYRFKSWVDGFSGTISVLAAFSYTQPAFEMIAARFPATLIGRAAVMVPRVGAGIAARFLLGRALLTLLGVGGSVFAVAIQVVIWRFSDDDLQEWCQCCAFGTDKQRRFKDPRRQMTEFYSALLEVT